jgi:hypothetical protein
MLRVLSGVLAVAILVCTSREAAPAGAMPPLSRSQVRAIMESPTRHVRAVDKRMAAIVADGMRCSATFAQLVLALDRSDVIVYIEATRSLPATLSGRLMLAAGSEGQRYLRIQITPQSHPYDLIALVGHELRHAIEVAESPDVRDEASLIALYQRIGHTEGPHHYDTLAAQDTGRQVRTELRGL